MQENLRRAKRKIFFGRRVSPQELNHLQSQLMDDSELDANYIVLTIGSCAIATLGLLANSAAVIIGAMIVAPLMLPIRALAFGALEGELDLFREALKAVAVGTVMGITLSFLICLLSQIPEYGSEVLARSKPTLLDLGIAIAAGGISGFAKIQPKLSSAIAGTAIAVALMPPLCVVGIGLFQGILQNNWSLSQGAFLLYLTNLLGIILACMVAFLIAGYTPLARARRGLGVTLALTGLLLLPLGISFLELVRQQRIESLLRRELVKSTFTFRRVDLISSNINWQKTPPEVILEVRMHRDRESITPKQVRELEKFIHRKMKRPFHLVFEINPLETVTNEDIPPPPLFYQEEIKAPDKDPAL